MIQFTLVALIYAVESMYMYSFSVWRKIFAPSKHNTTIQLQATDTFQIPCKAHRCNVCKSTSNTHQQENHTTYEYHKCLQILERQAFAIQLYFSIFPSFYCMITHAAGSSISANSDGNFQERPLSVRQARHASLSDRETSNQPQLYAMMMVIPTAHECNLLQTISISYQELKYSMMKENNKIQKVKLAPFSIHQHTMASSFPHG